MAGRRRTFEGPAAAAGIVSAALVSDDERRRQFAEKLALAGIEADRELSQTAIKSALESEQLVPQISMEGGRPRVTGFEQRQPFSVEDVLTGKSQFDGQLGGLFRDGMETEITLKDRRGHTIKFSTPKIEKTTEEEARRLGLSANLPPLAPGLPPRLSDVQQLDTDSFSMAGGFPVTPGGFRIVNRMIERGNVPGGLLGPAEMLLSEARPPAPPVAPPSLPSGTSNIASQITRRFAPAAPTAPSEAELLADARQARLRGYSVEQVVSELVALGLDQDTAVRLARQAGY